jgi:hypothetical protein
VPPRTWQDTVGLYRRKKGIRVECTLGLHRTLHVSRIAPGRECDMEVYLLALVFLVLLVVCVTPGPIYPQEMGGIKVKIIPVLK